MLNIQKQKESGSLTLSLEGRLDTTTASLLESELKDALDGVTSLTVDMEKLDYISSAGLRVLLSAQKQMTAKDGTMTVCHVNEAIMEIFEVTGFADILRIEN